MFKRIDKTGVKPLGVHSDIAYFRAGIMLYALYQMFIHYKLMRELSLSPFERGEFLEDNDS